MMPAALDTLSSAPPLHRSVSHPIHQHASPVRHGGAAPLANGIAAHRPAEDYRGGGYASKHAGLPHHLLPPQARSMPLGIAVKRQADLPLPQAPPLLDASALEPLLENRGSSAGPAIDEEEPGQVSAGDDMPWPSPQQDAEVAGKEAPTDAASTPASEEPPKRKRLGWGQGLARLRSTDHQLEPCARADSEASKHTDAAADSIANSASQSMQTDDPGSVLGSPASAQAGPCRQAADKKNLLPDQELLPRPPSLLMVDPKVVIEAPAEAAAAGVPETAQQPPASPAVAPVHTAASAAPSSPSVPASSDLLTPAASPSRAAATGAAAAQLALVHGTPQTGEPLATPSAAAEAGQRAGAAPTADQEQPEGLSKDHIMRRIDLLDAQIEALEAEVAQVGRSLEADTSREEMLESKAAELQVATDMEVAETSEGEDSVHAEPVSSASCLWWLSEPFTDVHDGTGTHLIKSQDSLTVSMEALHCVIWLH
jgi:hypothetical protein